MPHVFAASPRYSVMDGNDTVASNQGGDAIDDPASEIDAQFMLSAAILTLLEATSL